MTESPQRPGSIPQALKLCLGDDFAYFSEATLDLCLLPATDLRPTVSDESDEDFRQKLVKIMFHGERFL